MVANSSRKPASKPTNSASRAKKKPAGGTKKTTSTAGKRKTTTKKASPARRSRKKAAAEAESGPLVAPEQLTGEEAVALRQQLASAFGAGSEPVELDMSAVKHVDTYALLSLAKARNSSESTGRDFRVMHATGDVLELLRAAGVDA